MASIDSLGSVSAALREALKGTNGSTAATVARTTRTVVTQAKTSGSK